MAYNPILQALNGSASSKISPQLIAKAKAMMNTPNQLNAVMGLLGGRNPEQVVRQMAQANGIDIDELLKQIQSN